MHEHFVDKVPLLVTSVSSSLDQNKSIFDEQKASVSTEPADTVQLPYRRKNMPAVAGTLNWSQELRDRIQWPVSRLKQMNHGALESAETMVIFSKNQEMNELLAQ